MTKFEKPSKPNSEHVACTAQGKKSATEYALREIAEYWTIDRKKNRIRVCHHPENENGYDHDEFLAGQDLRSPQFAELVLPVDRILYQERDRVSFVLGSSSKDPYLNAVSVPVDPKPDRPKP